MTSKLYVPDFDNPLYVTFNYYKGSPGHMYMRNGDPGDPPEPSEIEMLSIHLDEFKVGPAIISLIDSSIISFIEEQLYLEMEAE